MYTECDSLTSWHEIAMDELVCRKNQSIKSFKVITQLINED